MQAIGNPYPATFSFDPPERVKNGRPLVNWFLAIPHLLVASALRYAAQLLAVVCWFIILFTGRLPTELANFQVMVSTRAAPIAAAPSGSPSSTWTVSRARIRRVGWTSVVRAATS